MSLFLRIFLFFWLTAALLAISFFTLGRLSGGEALERKREVLNAQAITVATLWQQGGHRLVRQWIRQLPRGEKPLLLDREGRSPFPMHARRHAKPSHRLDFPLEGGIQRHGFGHVSVVVAVPDISPAMFLVTQLEPRQLQRLPAWLWALSALLIISFISYLLALLLSRRIRQLRTAVQDFSEGDFDRRVNLGGSDEVSALASDFNRMAERVHDTLISQRRLVSDVSHELRSPLSRLRIALELAQRDDSGGEALGRIEKEADELESLVTGLLSLARIESSQFQLEKQDINLGELLREVVHDANFEGERKGCSVQLVAPETIILNIDPVLIRAAIENVVRNALRHAPENSLIQASTRRENGHCLVVVEDSGPGVPESALKSLFQPFTRVSEARERISGGFGLGLAITGRNLLAHGGQARAENRVQGGLRVTLTLPDSSPAA